MTLIQRLKNIWKLGEVNLYPNGHYEVIQPHNLEVEKPRMAQIIKKHTAIDKFLQDLKNE